MAQLRGAAQSLRQRQPGARFAVLMADSDDPDTPAVPRPDARVPCTAVGNVLVEFGVAGFNAEALAFLVRTIRSNCRSDCHRTVAACMVRLSRAPALQDGHGARPLVLKGSGPDPTLGCGVYASRHLQKGEPIDYDGGVLWEAPDFDAAEGGADSTRQLCATTLSAALLRPFGYTGVDLVSEMTTCAGYNLHYNDPSFYESPSRHAAEVTANVAPVLVMDLRPSALPRIGIMYFTTRAVAAGEELLQDWGGNTWEALSEMYLDGQARTAHWYHRYEAKLRMRAAARDVEVTPQQLALVPPVSGEIISFNPSGEGKFGIADYVVDNVGAAGAPDAAYVRWCATQRTAENKITLPVDQGLRVLPDGEVPAAFAASHCAHAETTDTSQLPAAVRAQLAAYQPFFPAADERMRALLRGQTPLKVAVAEVMATYSPARWISAPDTTAHALVVRPGCQLEKGEAACLYAGRLWTRAGFEAQAARLVRRQRCAALSRHRPPAAACAGRGGAARGRRGPLHQ
jgi:hypothetical protein